MPTPYERLQIYSGKCCPDLADVLMAIYFKPSPPVLTMTKDKLCVSGCNQKEGGIEYVELPLSTPVSEWGDETLESIIHLIE
jgi:hypothetical protein